MTHPLRVMIDARMLIGRFSGVARVVTGLVEHLAGNETVGVVALCGDEPYAPWLDRGDIEMVTSSFGREDRSLDRRLRWEAAVLPALIRQADVDVFHATWNFGVPRSCAAPCLLTIHDLIPLQERPTTVREAFAQRRYRRAIRGSARRASLVTTVSDYTKFQVINGLGVPSGRVRTIPNAVTQQPSAEAYSSDEPYALYVGGHEPRKNVAAVFETMRIYWERFDRDIRLRLTGHLERLDHQAARTYRRLADQSRIEFLGDVTDNELSGLYRQATALLFLSREEGFGLPALEAMAHGCPVIASDRTAIPEVVGDGGILVAPDDAAAAASALHQVLTDAELRGELVARGVIRAQRFTWSAMTASVLDAYGQVAAGTARPRTLKPRVVRSAIIAASEVTDMSLGTGQESAETPRANVARPRY